VLIDWFTVVAQIVNFLILVALLKYFLYGRIVRAMMERGEKIQARMDEAQGKKDEAEEELKLYQKKNRELEQRRDDLLGQIQEEANDRRLTLLREARDEVEKKRSDWRQLLEHQKTAFSRDLRRRAAHEITNMTRRALRDLAGTDLEATMAATFLKRLEALSEDQWSTFKTSLNENADVSTPIVVRSSSGLPTAVRDRLTRLLETKLHDFQVHYEVIRDDLPRIELIVRDRKIAWSVEDYLDGLEEEITKSIGLERPSQQPAAAESVPES
jgi:F-type H+-transporting ATPase subunit b